MSRCASLLLLLPFAFGCEPIVGEVLPEDQGQPELCGAPPNCAPVPELDPGVFSLPSSRVDDLPGGDDCDGDGARDADDPCLGFFDEDCAAALEACLELESGGTDLSGADLQGCRPGELVFGDIDLRGANLTCARISVSATGTVDLRDANLRNAVITVEGDPRTVMNASNASLIGTRLTLDGGQQMIIDGANSENATLFVTTTNSADPRRPGLLLTQGDHLSLMVQAGPRTEVRIEEATIERRSDRGAISRLVADEVSMFDVEPNELAVDANRLGMLGGASSGLMVRAEDVRIGGGVLTDATFATCRDIRISDARLEDVAINECVPGRLRLTDVEVLGGRIEGGLAMERGVLSDVALGNRPDSEVEVDDAEMDGVRMCAMQSGAFLGGDLQCAVCDERRSPEDFCVSGTTLRASQCQALEFSPPC